MTDLKHWFVLLTRSNFEQTVHKAITQKKIEAFLPTVKRKSIRKDRHLMIDFPLFPGYIFVKSQTTPVSQLQILKTTGAVRLLGNQTGPVPVPDSQIESLKLLTTIKTDLITGANIGLKKGDPVMIIEGPMAGVRGEFTHHKGKGRVVIKIDVLGQYAGVEVEKENVEKVPDLFA
ncbi:MAG: UpxY family transcription antiterminator [Proteobacteria bacterium]|nr:UpxY family transcription antiterminator [Pseudomonadota bacterium]MBU1389399.1 UpxY family transcription antiterminator [Pseudomonadota bacterium]MBU1541219.1 UpxY family transcription antiterminator [Pseudomonadota bacterium]MBU2430052.1 UpxY family transcription antiterminator [Pseudomonadota bacterium]MBU2479644.1 UpxY family transcription antiterminator [Pseudomonadota bacterium]